MLAENEPLRTILMMHVLCQQTFAKKEVLQLVSVAASCIVFVFDDACEAWISSQIRVVLAVSLARVNYLFSCCPRLILFPPLPPPRVEPWRRWRRASLDVFVVGEAKGPSKSKYRLQTDFHRGSDRNWFLPNRSVSSVISLLYQKRGMPPQKKCQLCKLHRSCYRRQCLGCHRLVGPGCFPEECLAADLDVRHGIRRGICRECLPRVLPSKLAVICRRLPRALSEVIKK